MEGSGKYGGAGAWCSHGRRYGGRGGRRRAKQQRQVRYIFYGLINAYQVLQRLFLLLVLGKLCQVFAELALALALQLRLVAVYAEHFRNVSII